MQNTNIPLTIPQTEQELGRHQQKFNEYVQEINELKIKLATRKTTFKEAQQKLWIAINEPQNRLRQSLQNLIFDLDKLYQNIYFKKQENEKIADFIWFICHNEFEATENEEIIALKNKYKSILGIEDFGMNDLLPNIEDFEKTNQEFLFNDLNTNKKDLAKLAKKQQEEINISLLTKTIYKDLAKACHPDKEQDQQKKIVKTEQMQLISKAFKEKDLYSLLQLKLKFLATEKPLANAPQTDFKYFNKVLLEQIKTLEAEIYHLNLAANGLFPNQTFAFFDFLAKEPKRIDSAIKGELQKIKLKIKSIEADLISFNDLKNVRSFLKSM
jgi:hypothetical protein